MSNLSSRLKAALAFDDRLDFVVNVHSPGEQPVRPNYYLAESRLAPLHEKLLKVVEAAEAWRVIGYGDPNEAETNLCAALAELRREVGVGDG